MAINNSFSFRVALTAIFTILLTGVSHNELQPGHPSLQEWLLPDFPIAPPDNPYSAEKAELGELLFFDPRLSSGGSMSCATCHVPFLGWSNGLPKAVGPQGNQLRRAVPTILNSGYNSLFFWDGRSRSLEGQALIPLVDPTEMNGDLSAIVRWLRITPGYKLRFDAAFPGEPISGSTIAKAIATFEITVISNQSPFDRWVRGEAAAMSPQQIRGFNIFLSDEKGNCAICHSAPNFTDESFHNIGLRSQTRRGADLGRFEEIPLPALNGAFKTQSLRDITLSAPYFHDGSANTLEEVVEFYVRGGDVRENISADMKELDLSRNEQEDLVSFLHALTTPQNQQHIPTLPIAEVKCLHHAQDKSDISEAIHADIDE